MADNDAAMREQLAALCHEQWAGWMRYLFDLTITVGDDCEEIQSADVKRWMRQIQTPYCELLENEKDSDRAEADRFLAILSATCDSLRAERDQLRKALAGLALTTESVTATAWSDNDSLIAERDSLREALVNMLADVEKLRGQPLPLHRIAEARAALALPAPSERR